MSSFTGIDIGLRALMAAQASLAAAAANTANASTPGYNDPAYPLAGRVPRSG